MLEWNALGMWEEGFSIFCEGLASNTSLTQLDLRNNQMNHQGAAELCVALKRNSTLQELGEPNQHITHSLLSVSKHCVLLCCCCPTSLRMMKCKCLARCQSLFFKPFCAIASVWWCVIFLSLWLIVCMHIFINKSD